MQGNVHASRHTNDVVGRGMVLCSKDWCVHASCILPFSALFSLSSPVYSTVAAIPSTALPSHSLDDHVSLLPKLSKKFVIL